MAASFQEAAVAPKLVRPGRESGGSPKSEKHWRDALRVALMRTDDGADERPRIYRIADRLVLMALDGDMEAIKEIGDRIDGKVSQQITVAPTEAMQQIIVTWAAAQNAKVIDVGTSSGDSVGHNTVHASPAVSSAPRPD